MGVLGRIFAELAKGGGNSDKIRFDAHQTRCLPDPMPAGTNIQSLCRGVKPGAVMFNRLVALRQIGNHKEPFCGRMAKPRKAPRIAPHNDKARPYCPKMTMSRAASGFGHPSALP
jgi:hypothetical protein